jgi:hypothetical protein
MKYAVFSSRTLALAFLVLPLFGLNPAAATTYDFSFTDQSYEASGTLTTGAASNGGYLITAITGTFSENAGSTDTAITGLLTPGTCCSAPPNDNILFYPGTPYLDYNGFAFSISGDEINIGYDINSDTYGIVNERDTIGDNGGSFTVNPISTTPLPAALPMFAGGLGMVGFLARRKKQKALAAA